MRQSVNSMNVKFVFGLIPGAIAVAAQAAEPSPLEEKTLVVWVAPANLTQKSGSALTIDDNESHFDGIIFGELSPKRWMPGSDFHRRTSNAQASWSEETADAQTFVQIAIAYQDRQVTVLRNGQPYAQYTMANSLQAFGPQSVAVIGLRHLEQGGDAQLD